MPKGEPNYDARQIAAASATGGVVGAGGRVITDSNPESTTQLVTKSMMNPDTGSSVAHKVLETITDKAPEFGQMMVNAADTGIKAAIITGGAVAAYKGAKKLHRAISKRQHGE
jgi:hypothetical protein